MAVQLRIDYDQLVELVMQLSAEQQKDLIVRLLTQQAQVSPLTAEERIQLLDAVKLHNTVNEEPSCAARIGTTTMGGKAFVDTNILRRDVVNSRWRAPTLRPKLLSVTDGDQDYWFSATA